MIRTKEVDVKYKDHNFDLGLSLKISRVLARMTLEEVAEKVGCSTSFLSLIERNKREPKFSTVLLYCEATGTTLFDVVERMSRMIIQGKSTLVIPRILFDVTEPDRKNTAPIVDGTNSGTFSEYMHEVGDDGL